MLENNNNNYHRWIDVTVRVVSCALINVVLDEIGLPNPFDISDHPSVVDNIDPDLFDSRVDSSPDYQYTSQETNTRHFKVTEDYRNV